MAPPRWPRSPLPRPLAVCLGRARRCSLVEASLNDDDGREHVALHGEVEAGRDSSVLIVRVDSSMVSTISRRVARRKMLDLRREKDKKDNIY